MLNRSDNAKSQQNTLLFAPGDRSIITYFYHSVSTQVTSLFDAVVGLFFSIVFYCYDKYIVVFSTTEILQQYTEPD